jgi:hypothetical protein
MNSSQIDVKVRPALDRTRLLGTSATGKRVGTEKHLNEKVRPQKK